MARGGWLAGVMAMVAAFPAAADAPKLDRAYFNTLRQADLRVAAIGYRLTTANAALCRNLQPELGMPLQALDQYQSNARVAADAAFGFETDVAVEAVVPGAPAALAGVKEGDAVVAIDGKPQPPKPASNASPAGTADTRIAAERAIAALPPAVPLTLTLRHDGRDRIVTIKPAPGCRTGVEMMIGPGYDADSDGEKIRIGSRFVEEFADDQLAAVIAHELSHTILEHRRRLEAANVSYGMLAEFGRNARLWRQTEDQADQLSAYLLYNAGYEPAAAVAFWRGKGARAGGGILRSRTHAAPRDRADAIEAEARHLPPGTARPVVPPLLASRDLPLK